VSISFTQLPADSTITNYSYSTDGTTYVALSPAQTSTPLIIPATGLTSGSSYTFSLKAINLAGSSSASTGVSSTFYMPPLAPTITSINSVSSSVNPTVSISLTQSPADSTITNYSWSIDGTTYTPLSPAQTSDELIILTNELTSGSSYTFSIKAINPAGSSSASTGVSSTFYMPPIAPTITSINSVSSSRVNPTVSISFTQLPADSTITNYSYSTDGTTYTPLSPAQTSTPLIIPATGLTSGSSYIFTIKAINPAGSSSASNSISSTFYMPPLAPTITSVSYNHPDSVKVYFTQTNNSGAPITGYSYSLDNGQTYTVKNGVTTSPLTISGLKSGITNSIVLKSNNGQDSAASNISSFTHYVSKVKKKVLT
jgi:titin